MQEAIVQEQIEYYRARAHEYEATAVPNGALLNETSDPFALEWQDALRAVRTLPQYPTILELACGTGLWTVELAKHTEQLTALDAAPEMLELNRSQVNDPRVRYECVNLFDWEPVEQYDLAFFAFWLSHVPESRLETFMKPVQRALKPGGQVFLLDEPRGTANVIPTQANVQERMLMDGRKFSIIKEYYDPQELVSRLAGLGLKSISLTRGDYFFRLVAEQKGERE